MTIIMSVPKKVEDGELYAKYSLFDAQAGNSHCCKGAEPSASSPRFQGNTLSVAVGVATRIKSPPVIKQIIRKSILFNFQKNL